MSGRPTSAPCRPGSRAKGNPIGRGWRWWSAGRTTWFLAPSMAPERPPAEWLWEAVLQAIRQPAMGDPHRPGLIEVASAEQRQALLPYLDRAGIECVVSERLEHLDSVLDRHGAALGRSRRAALPAGRAGDGTGAGGQLLRGGGRVLPPQALAAGAGRHADQGRVRQVPERAVVRRRDGPVRRAAGAGRLRRPGRPPGDDCRRCARKKRTRGGCRPCR